jgi:hypothetical protein
MVAIYVIVVVETIALLVFFTDLVVRRDWYRPEGRSEHVAMISHWRAKVRCDNCGRFMADLIEIIRIQEKQLRGKR